MLQSANSKQQAADSAAEAVEAAIGELIVAEKGMAELLQGARYALVAVEEENRRLRREVARAQLQWRTEQQQADHMGVSKDTLARLRRKKLIPFVRITPTVIRYSSIQDAQIAEALEVRGQMSEVRRRA